MRLLVLLCVTTAALGDGLLSEWRLWKERYGRVYADDGEESARRSAWQENYRLVEEHNRNASHGFTLALNHFADMTNEEFQLRYLSSLPVSWKGSPDGLHFSEEERRKGVDTGEKGHTYLFGLPSRFDWSNEGFLSPVKDQGDCGSCWAFSAAGALEGQYFKKKGKVVTLSEQQLMDCSWKYENYGCNGGNVDRALKYVENSGICSDTDYPYLSYVWKCMDKYCNSKVNCSGYIEVQSTNETALQEAVYNVGPISVALDASGYQFQLYSKGIYSSTQCDSTHLNHAMLITGYGTYYDSKYWIIKNSWGKNWGLSGYIRVARDKDNMCGVATTAMYPVLK